MATQDPSRQQSANRPGTAGQGTGAQRAGDYGVQGASGQPSGQASGQPSGQTQGGRTGSAQSRYGAQARGGYDVSPYAAGQTAGPFSLMHRISEEMDRLFENFGMGRNFFPEEMGQTRGGTRGQSARSLWSPHLEVCERNGKLLIEVDLPGVRREDVNVQIESDAVIIQGQRTQQSERSGQGYYHSERSYGSFYRTVPLPEGIDTEQATATFRNGVLEIEMPMPQPQQRGRRLEVRDAGSSGGGSTYEGTSSSSAGGAGNAAGGSAGSAAGTSVGGEHTSGGSR